MPSITFDQVSKRFGDVVAVNNLNLHVADCEFLVLVGPSGCGKTTALRCLAGLEEISAGTIAIGDQIVNDVQPRDRNIAMVFQSYALYPHMTVYDNLAFALRLREKTGFMRKFFTSFSNGPARQKIQATEVKIDKRVREVAETLGIGQLLKRKPKELSGGQRQRVALGRAIVRNPAVFLMDEPLSNLDAKLRVQTRAEIIKLHQQLETTFIYVTHDQTEAMTMGNRIAVMKDGLLQQLDTPQNLYDHPKNIFVASFIGSPGMNFLPATLEQITEELILTLPGAFKLPIPRQRSIGLVEKVGQTVMFGLRPENIHDAQFVPSGVDQSVRLGVKVTVVERMGSEAYVYVEKAGKEFVGRFDPRTTAKPGQTMEIVLDLNKMYLFAQDTGENLI